MGHRWHNAPAIVTDGAGGHRVVSTEVRDPAPGEVLVELAASGLCHTDVDSLRWGRRLVMGHEGSGSVRAVGDGVDLAVGQPVILNWAIPCGSCFQCASGRQHLCERRDRSDAACTTTRIDGEPVPRPFSLGTMSALTLVPAAACVAVPTAMPHHVACIVGCGVMTGFGSVVNAARVAAGSTVAVLGAGGVGLNVVQSAALAGARVIAIDLHPARLQLAASLGATDTITATPGGFGDVVERVRALTGGRGADVAFECTSVVELAAAPLLLVRNGGTAVQVSGFEEVAPFDLQAFEWDKTYINPLYGQCRPQIDIPRIVDLYLAGRYRLDEIVDARFTIDDLGEAIAAMQHGDVAKAVIVL
jgi:Zn-dependent alcohol dehydrogenase